jgi:hypothetical protein
MHNTKRHSLPNTCSWVVINSETMHGKCRNIKIQNYSNTGYGTMDSDWGTEISFKTSTFRWPVKIPSNLPRNTHNHVLDYIVP